MNDELAGEIAGRNISDAMTEEDKKRADEEWQRICESLLEASP